MAIHYGTYVGTPKQTAPLSPVDMFFERSKNEVLVRDVYTNVAATAENDTIEIIEQLGWESILDPDDCWFWNTAGGAGCTLSAGDATHPTGLLNAISIAAASPSVGTKLMQAVTPPNYYQPLWQQLGYASLAAAQAVSKKAQLIFTIGGAVFAAGTIAWKLEGARRD
jgi:hypothetical protein